MLRKPDQEKKGEYLENNLRIRKIFKKLKKSKFIKIKIINIKK